jgi:hypothetical protein
VTSSEGWKLLFPTPGVFFTFALRTHFPYFVLGVVVLSALIYAGVLPYDDMLPFGAIGFGALYLWIFVYKLLSLHTEIRTDAAFRERYVAMSKHERRKYFRQRGFDVELSF